MFETVYRRHKEGTDLPVGVSARRIEIQGCSMLEHPDDIAKVIQASGIVIECFTDVGDMVFAQDIEGKAA